jgi:CHAT domain-containing protein/tetratricopeptide (TPR) repeat protein
MMPRIVNLSLLALTVFLTVATPMSIAQRPDSTLEDFVRELVRSDSNAKRNELLASRKELVTTDLAKELVKQGNFLLLAGRYSVAFDVYTLAGSVSSQLKDTEGLASASLNLGTVHYFQGDYAPALDQYRKARTLFTSTANQAEAARALSGVALILKEQNQVAEALEVFAQALKEFEALDDKEEMANTLTSLGAIYYARGDYAAASKAFLRSQEWNAGAENVLHTADALYMQGDYARASDYYQQSLKSFEQEGKAAGLISALVGAANSNYYCGKYDEALALYRRTAIVQEQQRDESGVATSLQDIGNVYRALGDLGSALDSYHQSLAVAEQSEVKVSTASTLGSIGLVRAMQGDHTQASNYFKQSLFQFEATGDKVGMARMLGHLGNSFYAVGDYEPALESYRKSLALRESMDDQAGQASLLTGIGTVFMAQKNYPQALENYQQALRLYEAVSNKDAAAYVLTRLAETYFFQGDYPQTLAFAERAHLLAKEVESLSTSWYARMASGKAQRALDQPAPASQAFGEAVVTIESLRSQPAGVELGDGRSGSLPYLSQLELLIDQNKPLEAFDFAERAKVQALCDLLRKTSKRVTREMTVVEQSQEQKLIGDIVSISLQLDRQIQSRNSDEVRQGSLRNQLRQLRTAYGEFRKRLFASHPGLRVARGELPSLKLEETRALIADKQTALLEFVFTEDHAYLFALTLDVMPSNATVSNRIGASSRTTSPVKGRSRSNEPTVNLKVYPLNISNRDLAERVRQFQWRLTGRDEGFRPSARDLYDVLFKSAEEQLAGKTKLVIVPDGILWRLPFAALQPADDRYLIDQAAISYAPSLSALREMRKPRNAPSTRTRNSKAAAFPLTLAAFGNPMIPPSVLSRLRPEQAADKNEPKTNATEAQPGQAPQPFRERALDQPSAEVEIQKLVPVYGNAQSRLFVAAEASEEHARIEVSRANTVLHFAVPTILDDAIPMFSFSALAGLSGQQDAPLGDGLLQSWEIMNLDSKARLVVLSGAEMSGGRVGPGDAVAALTWAWFVAGTPTLMSTRWQVRSPALTQFMSDFHSGVQSGSSVGPKGRPSQSGSSSKAEALRQGMLRLIRSTDYQHPYYWSSFMLVGDAR